MINTTVKCPRCLRYSTSKTGAVGDQCGMTQPSGYRCGGLFIAVPDVESSPEPEVPDDGDDLDEARILLAVCHSLAACITRAYSLKAIAHVMLWQAEQQRNWKREQALVMQAAKEWQDKQRAAVPPMPPMPPSYYNGF